MLDRDLDDVSLFEFQAGGWQPGFQHEFLDQDIVMVPVPVQHQGIELSPRKVSRSLSSQ